MTKQNFGCKVFEQEMWKISEILPKFLNKKWLRKWLPLNFLLLNFLFYIPSISNLSLKVSVILYSLGAIIIQRQLLLSGYLTGYPGDDIFPDRSVKVPPHVDSQFLF